MRDEQKRILELEDKMLSLEKRLNRLAIIVEVKQEYPYWHKLLALGIREEDKANLEYVLSYLTSRLNQDQDFLVSKINGPDRFPEELFDNDVPTLYHTMSILKTVLRLEYDEIIEDILLSMYNQGMYTDLISHFFPDEVKKYNN